jgi:hypothetical protein
MFLRSLEVIGRGYLQFYFIVHFALLGSVNTVYKLKVNLFILARRKGNVIG